MAQRVDRHLFRVEPCPLHRTPKEPAVVGLLPWLAARLEQYELPLGRCFATWRNRAARLCGIGTGCRVIRFALYPFGNSASSAAGRCGCAARPPVRAGYLTDTGASRCRDLDQQAEFLAGAVTLGNNSLDRFGQQNDVA